VPDHIEKAVMAGLDPDREGRPRDATAFRDLLFAKAPATATTAPPDMATEATLLPMPHAVATTTSGADQAARPVETIAPPIWDAQVVTCREPELGPECGEGVCTPLAPAGFESGVCIYREGQHECPAGDYSVIHRHHSGVEDDRDCSYCACGAGTGVCDGSLQVYGSNDCTGAAQAAAPNVCTQGIVGGHSVGVAFTGDGSCPITMPPMPTGTIAPTGEFTFCCTP
jgi:hypothetical protein